MIARLLFCAQTGGLMRLEFSAALVAHPLALQKLLTHMPCHYSAIEAVALSSEHLYWHEPKRESKNREEALKAFLKAYKKAFNITYSVSNGDSDILTRCDLSLLDLYMQCEEWYAKRKTVQEFAKCQNELKRLKQKKDVSTEESKRRYNRRYAEQNAAQEIAKREAQLRHAENHNSRTPTREERRKEKMQKLRVNYKL